MAKTPTQNRVKSDRPRPARDFYETPYDLCYAYIKDHMSFRADSTFLDAGAGNGVWGKAIRDMLPRATIVGVEIEKRVPTFITSYDDILTGDYLSFSSDIKFDYVIGNPPYSLAEPFIRQSFDLISSYGEIHFLLPLAFLGSMKRAKGLFMELTPVSVKVSSRRPSFFSTNGHKTTDAIEYAMYRWQNNSDNAYPILKWFNWEYK